MDDNGPINPAQGEQKKQKSPFEEAPCLPDDVLQKRKDLRDFQQVSSFNQHAIQQEKSLKVYTWGRSDQGQLAQGTKQDIKSPQLNQTLCIQKPLYINSNLEHSAFITDTEELYMSGCNLNSQLGIGSSEEQKLDTTRVAALENYAVSQVSCGFQHTVARTDNGYMFSWGSSEVGQTGNGTNQDYTKFPKLVRFHKDSTQAGNNNLINQKVHCQQVAAGDSHTIALTTSGLVYSFGQGSFAALGHGDYENQEAPKLIDRLWSVGVVQIACGQEHCLALSIDHCVYSWGRGKQGQLGHGTYENSNTPQEIKALLKLDVTQIECGSDHSVCLSAIGEVWSWGSNTWGQLGLDIKSKSNEPQLVTGLQSHQIVQASCGSRHTLCLSRDSQIFAFGCNDTGQLGIQQDSSETSMSIPVKIPLPNDLTQHIIYYIQAGGDSSFLVACQTDRQEDQVAGPQFGRSYGKMYQRMALPLLYKLIDDVHQQQIIEKKNQNLLDKSIAALVRAIEDIYGSPGFLIAGFMRSKQSIHSNNDERSDSMVCAFKQRSPSTEMYITRKQQSIQFKDKIFQDQLDLDTIKFVYDLLYKLYLSEVHTALTLAFSSLLDQCKKILDKSKDHTDEKVEQNNQASQSQSQQQIKGKDTMVKEGEWLTCLLIILLNPGLSDPGQGQFLISKLADVTILLSQESQNTLTSWFCQIPKDEFAGRIVRPIQKYISSLSRSSQDYARNRQEIIKGSYLLSLLEQANRQCQDQMGQPKIPYSEFSSSAVSTYADLHTEYMQWFKIIKGISARSQNGFDKQHVNQRAIFFRPIKSLCQLPFIFTIEAKSKILQQEGQLQKHQSQYISISQALIGIGEHHPQVLLIPSDFYLELSVRRNYIVQDAIYQISRKTRDLKKPLKVTFLLDTGEAEEGVDQGGVSKEFFLLLIRDLFKPDYGMFRYEEETRQFWFALGDYTSEMEQDYELMGVVMGLAIYNNVILDLHFPLAVYKKLLGQGLELSDVKQAFPQLGKGLQQLLDFEGDVEATYSRNFEAEYDTLFGERIKIDLAPNGSNTAITNQNRKQYCDAYVKWLMHDSIKTQLESFRRGFYKLCEGLALQMFRAEDLELLVCGLPHYDFKELEKVAKYEGGFDGESLTIKLFWKILHELSLGSKKKFLQFTTGSDRAPVGGLGKLELLIQRAGPDCESLPTSHTCFNVLLLPEYNSEDKLRDKLNLAINNAQGFGLQ